MNKATLTIYCQHGNERFGALVAEALAELKQAVLLGNPIAFMQNKRFITIDMNRAYATKDIGLAEVRRAQQILKKARQYQLVLDIHSSTSDVGKVAIIREASPEILRIALGLGMERAVVMPPHIVEHALIGNVQCGISIEYGADALQTIGEAKRLAKRIANSNGREQAGSIEVFYIEDLLDSSYLNKPMQNYQYSSQINGYPFLYGEKEYATYAGFFARKKEKVIIGSDDE